ncbi:TSET complex member tstC-like [Microplitis mediator]|uniref:TSET complex member tstC-like n=1 Tax=Microplitis mediator TaxID=375433 RepID=UPI0025561487|nr:TSET complex member tstC-like [Microplitis mediator]
MWNLSLTTCLFLITINTKFIRGIYLPFNYQDHEYKINFLKGVLTNISSDQEEIKNTDELLQSHDTNSLTDKSEVYLSLFNYFGYKTSSDSEIVPSLVNSSGEENSKSISKLPMMNSHNFNRKTDRSKEKINSQNNSTLKKNLDDFRDNGQVNSTNNDKLFLSNLKSEGQINSTDNSKLSSKSGNSNRQINYKNILKSSFGEAFRYKKLVDLLNMNSYLDELMFNYDNNIPEHKVRKKVLDDKTFYLINRLPENK